MLEKFEGWRTRTPTAVGAVLLTAVTTAWVITAAETDAKWTDAVSGLIAFGALCKPRWWARSPLHRRASAPYQLGGPACRTERK